jgi:hypothetical protein
MLFQHAGKIYRVFNDMGYEVGGRYSFPGTSHSDCINTRVGFTSSLMEPKEFSALLNGEISPFDVKLLVK